jgi:hypothetical protein
MALIFRNKKKMTRYLYLTTLIVLGLIVSLIVYAGKNVRADGDHPQVAGVETNLYALDNLIHLNKTSDFEVYCDGSGYYQISALFPFPNKLPSGYKERFHLVNGRAYYSWLNYSEAASIISAFNQTQAANSKLSIEKTLDNCKSL